MLNLLPPEKKTNIEQAQLYQFVQHCCWLVISCSLLLSSAMGISWFISNIVLQNLYTHSTLVKKPDQSTTTNQLADIANLSRDLAEIQTAFRQPLPVLHQLITTLPSGITLSNASINYESNTLEVSGVASDREQLLALSQIVNNQSDWTNVKFPLKDFTQKTDIPFKFTVTLTPAL